MSKRVCISLITDENDNILMGMRADSNLWSTPGGHAEEGECPFICMHRELKEETDLDARSIKMIQVIWVKEKNLMLYLFKVTIDSNQAIDMSKDPDKEFSIVCYIDPNNVKDELHVPVEENIALQYWIKN